MRISPVVLKILLPEVLLLAVMPIVASAQSPFKYTIGDTVTITGYTGPGGALSIPIYINGVMVTSIGDGAFSSDSPLFPRPGAIITVTIPNAVTNIGAKAFYGASNLTSVKFPARLSRIGDMAFANCTSLTNVTLPDSVTSIGGAAFIQCTNLKRHQHPQFPYELGRLCLSRVQ